MEKPGAVHNGIL